MSAVEIIGGVRAGYPAMDPFAIIANLLDEKLHPTMSSSYLPGLQALHAVYAIQALLLITSLWIRHRRVGEVWVFRIRTSNRGAIITPHFAVCWQLWMLFFLIVLQPYLVMERAHAIDGNDWRGYIAGRIMGFIPAWQAVWAALWSLAVAVSLPRAGAGSTRQSKGFFSSPMFLNVHFIGGAFACVCAVSVPAIMSSIRFDRAVDYYRTIVSAYMAYSPQFPSMSSSDVDAALATEAGTLQQLLDTMNEFGASFSIAWSVWLAFILYAYTVFLCVSVRYFGYLRTSMKKIQGIDGKTKERAALKKAWLFAVLTSALVTLTGLAYAAASTFIVGWTVTAISTPQGLQTATFLSLYSEAFLGTIAAVLSLAQTLVGSQKETLAGGSSTSRTAGTHAKGTTNLNGGVSVNTLTHTHIDEDSAVVQLELADWAQNEKMGGGRGGENEKYSKIEL